MINIITRDREIDSDLRRQINEDRLHIREKHFQPDEMYYCKFILNLQPIERIVAFVFQFTVNSCVVLLCFYHNDKDFTLMHLSIELTCQQWHSDCFSLLVTHNCAPFSCQVKIIVILLLNRELLPWQEKPMHLKSS